MAIYSEETLEISMGSGLYSADLPSAIPDGFCSEAINLVPTGQSIESRYGFRRSNIDYYQIPSVPAGPGQREEIYFSRIESNQGNTLPAMVWGGRTSTIANAMFMVRDGLITSNPITPAITDAYAIINLGGLGAFRGAVNYNGTMYINTTVGIYRVNSITWSATPSISTTLIQALANTTTQLFHFQDRLWVAVGNKLHFTDPPSSPGGNPETWAVASNFIAVVGKTGPAQIMQVIPLGTRLFIFTNLGMYILSTLGAPTDWYLKSADLTVRCNTISTAFELSGVIYYICTLGVFATTGSSVVKLSGSVENVFLAGNQISSSETGVREFTEYRINYLDGGMLISISPQIIKTDNSSFSRPFYDSPRCVTLYSRADSIAWSEWEFPPNNWETDDVPVYDRYMNAVIAVADSLSTYINSAPQTFAFIAHSNSKAADVLAGLQYPAIELFNYDGFEDTWTSVTWTSGTASAETTVDRWLNGFVRTSFFTGLDRLAFKEFKYAFLDLFMPNAKAYSNLSPTDVSTPYWRYAWFTDQRTYIPPDEVLYDQPAPDTFAQEFSSIKIKAGFFFRSVQFELKLWTKDNTNFKIRSLFLKQFTHRDAAKPHQ